MNRWGSTTAWGDYTPPKTTTTNPYWPTYSPPAPSTPTAPSAPTVDLTADQEDLLSTLSSMLGQFFSPSQAKDLIQNVIKPGLLNGFNEFEIMTQLRQTDTWRTAFPEWQQRIDAGFAPMTENEIRLYRDEAKRIAKQWSGVELTNDQISKFITSDRSLTELEQTLQTWEKFQTYGQDVQNALSLELGRPIGDDEAFMFLSDDYSTPELDMAYRNAVYKGYTQTMKLRAPSDSEVALLNERNVSVEDAVSGYQKLASNLPTYDRLYAIDQAIANDDQNPYDSFGDLLKNIFAQDPDAQLRMSQALAREGARFSGSGGIAGGGQGLLAPGERR